MSQYKTLVPRTQTTARAHLARRGYTCLGCGDPLPIGRGGHCDACVEWDDPPPPAPPTIDVETDPIIHGQG